MSSHSIISRGDLKICSCENPSRKCDEEEDESEDGVGFQGEDEEREEGETPDNQIQSDDCIVLRARRTLCSVSSCRIRGCQPQRWELEHSEGEPED